MRRSSPCIYGALKATRERSPARPASSARWPWRQASRSSSRRAGAWKASLPRSPAARAVSATTRFSTTRRSVARWPSSRHRKGGRQPSRAGVPRPPAVPCCQRIMMPDDGTAAVRLDIWLDVACLFSTRSEAQRACQGGKVDVNGQAAKPHRLVRAGDELRITRPLGRRQIVGGAAAGGPACPPGSGEADCTRTRRRPCPLKSWRRAA